MKEQKKKSPHDVVEEMMLHVIESLVRRSPYIVIVTKRQLWFGNGMFKSADDIDAREGLRKFLGIRIPSKAEIDSKNSYYGYPALQSPWTWLNNFTNTAVRQSIEWKTLDGADLSDIRIMKFNGYIRKDGSLDPKETKGIAGYVMFLQDPQYREQQNEYIRKRVTTGDEWFGYQILRAQVTHPHILAEKKKAASTIVKNNRKLLLQKEYLELDPAIDRNKIEWKDYK